MGLAVPGAPPGSAVGAAPRAAPLRMRAPRWRPREVSDMVYVARIQHGRTAPRHRDKRARRTPFAPTICGITIALSRNSGSGDFPARGTRGEVLPAGNPHRTPTLSPVTLRPRANRTLPNAAHRACRHCNTTWHTTQRAPHASPSRTRAAADHGSLASTPRMLPLRSMISSGLRLRT